MSQPRKLLFALAFCSLVTPNASSAEAQISDSDALAAQLVQEFHGAYPENPLSSGKIHNVEVTAAPANWGILPPFSTAVWAYNGTVPGPIIRIKLGDTLKFTLHNRLPQPTTIHWHGVRVPNAMDGVPGVTQPPIAPGESFTYEFTPKDAGTFWFHPHLNAAEQIERGLHGVLVVEAPDEPQYSQDLVWVLDDWLLEKGAKIHEQFVTGHDLMHDGRWGNVPTINGRYRPSIPVKAGERLRIRMVNAANARVFIPQFEGLQPIAIAIDGMPAGEPFPLQSLLAAPGNRIDIDVVIPKSAAGKTLTVKDAFGDEAYPMAFLQVEPKTTVATPGFKPPQAKYFPNWEAALNIPVAHEFLLNATRGGQYGITWSIDRHSGHDGNIFDMQSGHFYRLRFTNQSYRLHPMHLHGQFFKLLAVNGVAAHENFWRDTILIGPKQFVDIGLVPIDKGSWASHCHILEHAEAGMMATIGVK